MMDYDLKTYSMAGKWFINISIDKNEEINIHTVVNKIMEALKL